MAQESPLLETSLIVPVDTLVERIEPTHIEPFVEGVTSLDETPIVAEVFGVVSSLQVIDAHDSSISFRPTF